jgi:hypothetical protein
MSSDISVTINPPAQIGVTIAEGIPKHASTHAPGASDSLSSYYVTGNVVRPSETGVFITSGQTGSFVTGSVVRPSETGVFVTTGQTGSFITSSQTGAFVTTGSTGSFVTGSVVRPNETGSFVTTGQTGNFITQSQTGQFVSTGSTGNFILTSQTGQFVGTGQTGQYTGVFYPYTANPNGYVQGSVVRPSNTGAFLDTGSSQTINSLKNFLVRPTVNGTGVLLSGEASVTGALTGAFYPLNSNPSGYITGVDLTNYVTKSSTGVFVTTGQTGNFVTTSQTGAFVTTGSTGSFVTSSQTGQFVGTGQTGNFVTNGQVVFLTGNQDVSGVKNFYSRPTVNGTGVLLSGEAAGAANTGSLTGVFYPLNSNPSGYITGVDLSSYVTTGQTGQFITGSVVRPSETGNFVTTSQTGQFVATGSTGAFLITGAADGRYVSLTGNQDVSGLKDFQTRPTVTDIPVLISGDPVDTVHLYGKNDQGSTIYKGQPVYIGGANGTNPLIKIAANTGEFSSSKTIGLLAQDLLVNELGYVITEGTLEGFDTSAGNAGDPMWLGPTGNILYGTGNKPYGLNNLVYLGVVLRSQSSNGKVYVQIQNGFEMEELHNVYAVNPTNKDSLLYNSSSGAWFARQISTGDVSGISAYALAANTGSFITTGQTGQFVWTGSTGSFVVSSATGAFLTTGAADGRYYSLSNGQSISGFATTGFNNAVTGMTITGDATKVITLFQRGGTTVTGSFTDNAGTGGGGTGSISVNDSNLIISTSMFA